MWRLFQEKSRGSSADFINILEAAEDMSSTVFIRRSSVLGEYSLGGGGTFTIQKNGTLYLEISFESLHQFFSETKQTKQNAEAQWYVNST